MKLRFTVVKLVFQFGNAVEHSCPVLITGIGDLGLSNLDAAIFSGRQVLLGREMAFKSLL